VDNPIVALTGLSNTYSHYTTTPEEYNMQRYEAASTLYGPKTLQNYIGQFNSLITSMMRVRQTFFFY